MAGASLVWLRDDLRLADNPALTAAADRGEPIVIAYLLDDESAGVRPLGAASRWWLHQSLTALNDSLGGHLVLRRGPAERAIPELVAEIGAGAVFWNRRYTAARDIDARLKARLRDDGLDTRSFAANLLVEPWTLTTGGGGPYRVFTPFWKAAQEQRFREPLPVPEGLGSLLHGGEPAMDELLPLPQHPDWTGGLRDVWTPGEAGAHEQLESFASGRLQHYDRRDEPAVDGTSHLSPHLRFGEVSPFQVWQRMHGALSPGAKRNVPKFLSELGWREFNGNILFHAPQLAEANYRPAFDAFPWSEPDPAELEAWQRGRTGIPLVDAGMRELWATGYMHNRVRMIVASFLTKNLLIDWRIGEKWFWDTLVDADEASNPANWQWVAGSGADAAPYFRVFNPELQRQKFDAADEYVKRWVPEVGSDAYPAPIVDLRETRAQALEAYEHVKANQRIV